MELAGPVFASEDFREGLLAFAQKRAPQWSGR
jgi:enoyl-CoA hydratase/carnithine racemase